MKRLLFISLLISLMLAACGGGMVRDNGSGDTLIPVVTLYHHDGIEF
ncbi:MAG: hypothetical protein K2G77_06385 [Muribaculaceae bacterium]|nr:hypothetical protein [Muribaculaceae bacterium]